MFIGYRKLILLLFMLIVTAGTAGGYLAIRGRVTERVEETGEAANQVRGLLEGEGEEPDEPEKARKEYYHQMLLQWGEKPQIPEDGFSGEILSE